MTPDLIGLRDDDLSPAERAARDELAAQHPVEVDHARRLAQQLPALAHADGGPTLADLKRQPTAGRGWGPPAALAMAATALLAVGFALWPADATRYKGAVEYPAGAVQIEAFAEGPDGVRELRGATVTARPDERVLFRLRAAMPGELQLVERHDGGHHVIVPSHPVAVGDHTPGGATPHTWRPDTQLDQATYTALLCPEAPGTDGGEVPPGCAAAELTVRWQW